MAIQKVRRLPEAALPAFRVAATALALAYVASGAAAAETSHGTHEHGAAELELAVEGSDVVVNFASPMYNLVGFEYAPRDEQDRDAVAAARVLLDDPANLVLLQADAGCAVVELEIDWDVPSAEEEEHDHDAAAEHDAHDADEHDAHEHDAHDADEHDAHDADGHDADEHDADEHAAHDADEADHHDDHDTDEQHADVAVAVRYTCENPDRLNSLDITAFESFERLSEVELSAVGPGGAVSESREQDSPGVDLRGLFGG